MPALRALVAQVLAALGVWLGTRALGLSAPELLPLALLQGGLAALLAWALRSDPWWLPIHLLFAPAVVAALRLPIAPAWYLAAFVLLALTYWSSFRTQVPLYLTNRRTAAALLALLPRQRAACVIDLGSGSGALLRRLAQARPDCRFVGIEAAPLPSLVSRLAPRPPNLALRRGDFWREHLGNYDIVYAFLSPVPMPRLWRKACAEMRPGTLLISNSFAVPGVEPAQVIQVGDRRRTRLHCYRMGAPAAAE